MFEVLKNKQSIKNKAYIEHLYFLFKEFCGSKPIVLSNFDNRPDKMKEYTAIKFQTALKGEVYLVLINIKVYFIRKV